jgi:prefoldin subunit 5
MAAGPAGGFAGRTVLMADEEHSASGMVPGLVQELIAQFRRITEDLEGLTRVREHLPLAPGALPLPGSLSAAQLATIADSIAAQRRSIEALKSQLTSFDEQLAVLEQLLGPLAQWSSKWAEVEEWLLKVGRGSQAEGQAKDL